MREKASKSASCLVLLALGSGLLATLALGDQVAVDVGEDTTLGDCDAREELAELIVVADGKGDVARLEGSALISLGPRTREYPRGADALRLQSTSLSVVFLALAVFFFSFGRSSGISSFGISETHL